VIDQGVAHRYAQALFGAALGGNAIDAVRADLESLESWLSADPTLIRFLESPMERDEDKVQLIEKLFRGRTTDLLIRLLLLLLRKKRIAHLLDIVRSYRALVEEHQGVVEARVTTAVPLPQDLKDRLAEELEQLAGKKVRIRARVDPRIIGGVIVMIQGKILDRSIRHELEKLRDDLLAVQVH